MNLNNHPYYQATPIGSAISHTAQIEAQKVQMDLAMKPTSLRFRDKAFDIEMRTSLLLTRLASVVDDTLGAVPVLTAQNGIGALEAADASIDRVLDGARSDLTRLEDLVARLESEAKA